MDGLGCGSMASAVGRIPPTEPPLAPLPLQAYMAGAKAWALRRKEVAARRLAEAEAAGAGTDAEHTQQLRRVARKTSQRLKDLLRLGGTGDTAADWIEQGWEKEGEEVRAAQLRRIASHRQGSAAPLAARSTLRSISLPAASSQARLRSAAAELKSNTRLALVQAAVSEVDAAAATAAAAANGSAASSSPEPAQQATAAAGAAPAPPQPGAAAAGAAAPPALKQKTALQQMAGDLLSTPRFDRSSLTKFLAALFVWGVFVALQVRRAPARRQLGRQPGADALCGLAPLARAAAEPRRYPLPLSRRRCGPPAASAPHLTTPFWAWSLL